MLSTAIFRRISKKFIINLRVMSSDKIVQPEDLPKKSKEDEKPFQLPAEPDNCCMSGCENCVWIQYAKDLTDLYNDSGETAKKILLEKIKDPTMQVFLRMELKVIEKGEKILLEKEE